MAFLGKLAALEERRKTLDDLIDNLIQASSTDTVKADKELVEAQIGLSLGIINRQFGTRWKEPQLTPLVMLNERLRLQIESLKKKIQHSEEELSLNKQKLAAGVTELAYLSHASGLLDRYSKTCKKTVLIEDFIKGGTCGEDDKPEEKMNVRETIGRILLQYANSWTISRTEEEILDAKLRGLRHKVVLDNSDDAFAQWDNLLRVTTSQFVALHGSGVTTGDVARFIAALAHVSGLFYIGSQVQ